MPATRHRGRRRAEPRRVPSGRGAVLLGGLLIVAAGLWAYHDSLDGAFVQDDITHIQRNPYIRDLGRPAEVLGHTSRPVVQLTLAMNYAMSGIRVGSYHATNLVIHLIAALLLFGLMRRTLLLRMMPESTRRAAPALALAATLLWIVHPVTTEAVTYVIQRGESLAALLYLLVLYGLVRGAESQHPWRWYGVAIAACLIGMGTKPVMVTAPLMALAYDRIFLAGSFRDLWSKRGRVHVALFATVLALPLLLAAAPTDWRYSTGTGVAEVGPARYAMTQAGVLLHYLGLAFWPRSLCFDYAWPPATSFAAIAGPALVIVGLVGWTAWLVARGHPLGFLGVWFFLILAPTSSFIPVLDPAVEHRLYLPLAAVTLLVVLAGQWTLEVLGRRLAWRPWFARLAASGLVACPVLTLGTLTVRRNADYRSAIALWSDTVAKRPDNARARVDLAHALAAEGRLEEAIAQVEEALRRTPDYAWGHMALGYFFTRLGRSTEGLPHLERAAKGLPMSGEAHYLLGSVLSESGHLAPAIDHLTESVRLKPWRMEAQNNLGIAYTRVDRPAEAVRCFEAAIRLDPSYANAHFNLGTTRASLGDLEGARRELLATLAINPGYAPAQEALQSIERAGQATP